MIQAFSKRLDMAQITILMFTYIILAGTILLMTPMAQKQELTLIDAPLPPPRTLDHSHGYRHTKEGNKVYVR